MRTNYVLIDYENVQPPAVSAFEKPWFKVIVFVGANRAHVPFSLAIPLQRLGANARYIQIAGNGPNALDFHIAYYIGRLAVEEPEAYFHIISKDKGFDPLIAHLKSENIYARRSANIEDIPAVRFANAKTVSERIDLVISDRKRRGAARPGRRKTLENTIGVLLGNAPDEEIAAVIEQLKNTGMIAFDGEKIVYSLPE